MTNIPITVSKEAVDKISALLANESADTFFRITVNSGGCSGFQYEYKIDNKITDGDIIIEENEKLKVVTDDISAPFLNNSILDHHQDLSGEHFLVKNPNATAKCGCGNSFSV